MTQTNDQQIEQEIQAKGLTAPCVTPEHIASVIRSEFYFTAGDGVRGESHMGTSPAGIAKSLNQLTTCVLVLRNGFTVTGESACVSPENFNAELGRKYAREKAINKIWELEGYLLKQRLYEQSITVPADAETVTLYRDQLVNINGIPFFLLGDVQAYAGSKGNIALAFEPQPECSE